MNNDQKKFWTGFGIGAAVSGIVFGVTGFCVSKNIERKKSTALAMEQRHLGFQEGNNIGYSNGYVKGVEDSIQKGEKAVETAYNKGVDDAMLEAQKWMDDNLIQVDSNDPAAIQKAIDAQAQHTASNPTENVPAKTDDVYAEKGSLPEKVKNEVDQIFDAPETPTEKVEYSGKQYYIQLSDGTHLAYPIELFCDNNGFLGPSQARANLIAYEHDSRKLKLVWKAMNWGDYIEDPNEIPSIETINNWNMSLADVNQMLEDSKDDPEPEERTIEFERYMDRVDAYRNNPNTGIKYISEQEYREESHLDHIEIDYYELDNVFLQPDSNDRRLEDPITDLGVSDGKVLFEHIKPGEDPDVIYVENFGQHFVAEVTRYHKSSTGIMDGSAYMNGETGVVGGASGV